MKRGIIAVLAALSIMLTAVTMGAATAGATSGGDGRGKITFCHATSSHSNPYTFNTTSTAAFYNSGHVDHAGDIYPAGSHGDRSWPARGDQSILANGCEAPPTDACDELPGDQPEGTRCEAPPTETRDKISERCEWGKRVIHHFETTYSWNGSEWVGTEKWVGKDYEPLTAEECGHTPETHDKTTYRCAWGVKVVHHFVRNWIFVDKAWVLGPKEWVGKDKIALTSDEKEEHGCAKPDEPEPFVTTETRESCEEGVQVRTTWHTYAWNHELWDYVEQTVVGEWMFERALSDEEYERNDCRPDQPEPTVRVTDHAEVDCELGGVRSWTTTYSTPVDVWDAEARRWIAGVEGPGVNSEPVLTAYTNGECDEASPEDEDPKGTNDSNGGDTEPIVNAAPEATSTPGTLPNAGGPEILAGLLALMLLAGGGAMLLLRRRMQ